MLEIRIGQMDEIVFKLKIVNKKLFKDVGELFKEIKGMEKVKNNIVFVYPVSITAKPQSKYSLTLKNLGVTHYV